MNKKIKMITFDLDDTLWDNRPTIIKAEIDTRKWIEDKVGKVEWGDFNDFLELREEVKDDIDQYWPQTQRRVGGYNIDLINPEGFNTSNVLVGSEGTLSLFNKIKLKLWPIPKQKVLGVCYFESFSQAMELTKEMVKLKPTTVELLDHNLIGLAKQIPIYAESIKKYILGNPEAVLMVEFIDDDLDLARSKLKDLENLVKAQNQKNNYKS